MNDSWHRIDCHHCQAVNWFQQGSEEDIEVCKCRKCGKWYWPCEADDKECREMLQEYFRMSHRDEDPSEYAFETGKARPS